jgi:hypothetical protein
MQQKNLFSAPLLVKAFLAKADRPEVFPGARPLYTARQ